MWWKKALKYIVTNISNSAMEGYIKAVMLLYTMLEDEIVIVHVIKLYIRACNKVINSIEVMCQRM